MRMTQSAIFFCFAEISRNYNSLSSSVYLKNKTEISMTQSVISFFFTEICIWHSLSDFFYFEISMMLAIFFLFEWVNNNVL